MEATRARLLQLAITRTAWFYVLRIGLLVFSQSREAVRRPEEGPKKRKESEIQHRPDTTHQATRPPTRVLHQPQRHLNSNKSGRPQETKGETEERKEGQTK
ncbi:uncharacterized protein LOC144037104 isoform X2 [Vanacampus margaritifer]